MILKGKNLLKLHNCFLCHNIFYNKFTNFNIYPKIKNQYLCYLMWTIKQYRRGIFRNNFLMKSQVQNLSYYDIKKIFSFINKKI
ncbi:MAG: c-type cytochrome [Candidatus Nasuia deltocephalinicola]